MLVLRDGIFGNPRRFREMLHRSKVEWRPNVLSNRLKRLVAAAGREPWSRFGWTLETGMGSGRDRRCSGGCPVPPPANRDAVNPAGRGRMLFGHQLRYRNGRLVGRPAAS